MRDFFGERDPNNMPRHMFGRAHHVEYSTAVRADVSKQNFSVCPRHWYIDADFECERCGKNFGFTADEQRHWYEELKFNVGSTPRECRTCRRELREIKQLKQEYDREIAETLRTDSTIERKQRLIQVIETLATCGFELPAAMDDSLRTLRTQIARANTH